jgi:YidC/Oxa1 family membrane protein insertase
MVRGSRYAASPVVIRDTQEGSISLSLLIATSWLDPIVYWLGWTVNMINTPIHNLGVSLIILAALIRLVFWPLNTKQFKSMIAMQKLAPKIKALQARYKNDPQKLQTETMAMYKEAGANPLSGCLPLLVQYPFLIGVYWMVLQNKALYQNQDFLWIGSGLSQHSPALFGVPILGASLAHADLILLVLYAASMYISVRYGSMPATDPQQAQTQKMMAIMSPLMLAFIGFKYQWPSALYIYWFSSNLFQMGQQFYLLRKYHEPLSFIDSAHAITETPAPDDLPDVTPKKKLKANGSPAKTYKVKKKTKGANS